MALSEYPSEPASGREQKDLRGKVCNSISSQGLEMKVRILGMKRADDVDDKRFIKEGMCKDRRTFKASHWILVQELKNKRVNRLGYAEILTHTPLMIDVARA